ncbi:MAG TPA: LptF/LptG family permease, partial [Burkholderiales bacterium]|nr:LptF/LptG family permease [Burkholderiales bacterium]
GPPGSAEFRIVEFEKYSVRIEANEVKDTLPSVKALPMMSLLADRSAEAHAELVWRTGLPLSALVLSLLAIPMSFVNPRAGRSLNLMLAALLYMVYTNLVSIVQAWVAQEKVGVLLGMWSLHAAMLMIVAVMFYLRVSLRPLVLRKR